ncbi:hypothetical protein [Vallitalea maricola]|uniref:Uncharacterized protein n=1 Tax=Vallitalea maricola TaxID=3074433 RepID=A0ACB5ULX6_9FIRM|nr:hypothetical protein AN2V17_27620 [Vallitalea sp. AN17-2]
MNDIKSIVDYIVFLLIRDEWTEEQVATILSQVKGIMADTDKQPKFIKCKVCGYKYCQEQDNYCTSCGVKL